MQSVQFVFLHTHVVEKSSIENLYPKNNSRPGRTTKRWSKWSITIFVWLFILSIEINRCRSRIYIQLYIIKKIAHCQNWMAPVCQQIRRNNMKSSVSMLSSRVSFNTSPILQLRSNAFLDRVILCVHVSLSFLGTRLSKPLVI